MNPHLSDKQVDWNRAVPPGFPHFTNSLRQFSAQTDIIMIPSNFKMSTMSEDRIRNGYLRKNYSEKCMAFHAFC